MSGSSLDGLDIAYVEFEESGGHWTYRIDSAACLPYAGEWRQRLADAIHLSALDYQLLHSEYGHHIGREVNEFIERHGLHYRVSLVASHGHTTFHMPPAMTGQLGCGAAIAAETGLPVVSDLRALDVALGGQGAPIVPMGEKLLFEGTDHFLNIGGIANISANLPEGYVAFDVCPANRVLNMLAEEMGMPFDEGGKVASAGTVDQALLLELNALDYYDKPYPKSLANDFGTDIVYPLIRSSGLSVPDALRTFCEHIALQVLHSAEQLLPSLPRSDSGEQRMLVTGGGALNGFLVGRIDARLASLGLRAQAADELLANYKEALIMAFLGVLRWREEETSMPSVTGARKGSIGGALWMGG
jgi:anhydro-N-acetylmuramic acid kinase